MVPRSLKAPSAPRIPPGIEPRALTSLRAFDCLETCRLDGCDLSKQKAERVAFDAVRVEGGTMAESRLSKLRWTDVACARTDLSTVVWEEAKLTTVEFRDCRMTGAILPDAELDGVRFVGCHMAYASFSGAKFRQVSFSSCRLDESIFTGAKLMGTSFFDCELGGVDLEGATLKDVDVSTSRLSQVKVGVKDLRGLIVSREQAAALAALLGLVVRP
jgi:uncharacterized protein YjbI with pentapeptide repeats